MNISGINSYSLTHQIKPQKAGEHDSRGFQDALALKSASQKAERSDSIIITKSEQAPAAESVKASVNKKIVYEWPTIQSTTNKTTIAKLAKLREAAEKTDYTGMTPTQVFKEIHDRYNDAFDGNILVITNFALANGREWADINSQYNEELGAAFRTLCKEYPGITHVEVYREMLGYGDMTINEVEAAIVKKYEGKDTTFDFMSMMGEMLRTGVLDRMGTAEIPGAKFIFIEKLGYGLMGRFAQGYSNVSDADVENMFRSKINFNALVSGGTLDWKFLNAFVLSGTAERADDLMGQLLDRLFSDRSNR